MKNWAGVICCLLTILVLCLPTGSAFAEEAVEDGRHLQFSASTAYTVEQGRWELGLFGPLRYGLTDRVELSTHPLWFFLAPNLRAKVVAFEEGTTQVSWVAGLTYATPLLRFLAREGAGGILPPDRSIPHILSIYNEVMASRPLGDHILTTALGVQVAPRFGQSELISIDVPVVYPRTAAFFTHVTAIGRVGLQGPILGNLEYRLDGRAFIFPGADGAFAIEQGGRLHWQSSPRWMLQAGYLASYGGFAFGTSARVLPVVEIAWGF